MTERRRGIPARRRFFNPDRAPRSNWEAYAQRYPERAKFYQSAAWTYARTKQLMREPNCVVCGEPATIVDHTVPRAEYDTGIDPSNLQSMCKKHHHAKTMQESHRGRKRAAQVRKIGERSR